MNPSTTEDVAVASPDDVPVDGRTARRDRNRTAVLDAVIELFDENNLAPGVHEVAHRSGISLRSVYRYFADIHALISAAIERQYELSAALFVIDGLGEGPVDDRIRRFSEARIELFEAVRTVFAAATVRARLDSQVADGLAWSGARLSEQVQAMFAPELAAMGDDAEMAELTLDILSQFETIELLRGTRRLSVDDTVTYLVEAFTEILT